VYCTIKLSLLGLSLMRGMFVVVESRKYKQLQNHKVDDERNRCLDPNNVLTIC
jgi:hypothetical protein